MTERPTEATEVHTRLLKCALEVEDSRAYWQHSDPDGDKATPQQAFDDYWFGARSLARITVLLTNFRTRYDQYASAFRVLTQWKDMEPDTRRLVCHWHLQLADPVYRRFTGEFLVERRQRTRPEVTRDVVVSWVSDQGPNRWTMATRIQFASKLLSSALSAGLVTSNRDPRPLQYPRVGDDALGYVMYLLRGVDFAGTLLDNPYAASVGLDSSTLEGRLRSIPALRFHRQGDLIDFGWRYPDIGTWAGATLGGEAAEDTRGMP